MSFDSPAVSAIFLVTSGILSIATYALARAHFVRVFKISSGQTSGLTRKLSRLPVADRLKELRRQARPNTIESRIADEALGANDSARASAVDSVLADVALELDSRAMWPKAAVRIAGASGVLLMALSISQQAPVMISVIVLLVGIGSAGICAFLERRALAISTEIRLRIDALVDVLELRARAGRPKGPAEARNERRMRRRYD